jgi:DNA-binding NarL/FixJ family response regulator
MINLILVSKQPSVNLRLREQLLTDEELEVLDEISNADEALEKVDLQNPNILLLYSGEADTDAISLADDLKQHDGIDADPQEIFELMMEFDRQDAEESNPPDEGPR